MKLEVDNAVLKLLDGEITPSLNLAVVLSDNGEVIESVNSSEFTSKELRSMFMQACIEINNHIYGIRLKQIKEELNGVEINCKLSLSALKTMGEVDRLTQDVSLRLFGPDIDSSGTLMIFEGIKVYPLLSVLVHSPSYYRIDVLIQ
jgi:hypothetical protein